MRQVTETITKAEYEKYCNADYKTKSAFFAEKFPAWHYGYGIYGFEFCNDGDKYTIDFTIGDSCD